MKKQEPTMKIVYEAIDNGIDGRDKDNILYATFSEEELKELHSKDKSKVWRRLSQKIINVKVSRKQALAKLNSIDRLVLGLPNWIEEN